MSQPRRTLLSIGPTRRARRAAVGILAILGAGVVIGMCLSPTALGSGRKVEAPTLREDCQESTARHENVKERQVRARSVERPYLVRPADLLVPDDREREHEYRVKQSEELVQLLIGQLDAYEATHPGEVPESYANHMGSYQVGLMDAITRTAPDLAEELSEQVESTLCNHGAKESHQIVMARLIQSMPELASVRAADCVFQRGSKEDMVLWTMLDAVRNANLPSSKAIEELRRSATDPRTRRRLSLLESGEPPAVPSESDGEP